MHRRSAAKGRKNAAGGLNNTFYGINVLVNTVVISLYPNRKKAITFTAISLCIIGLIGLEVIAAVKYHASMWGLHSLHFIYPRIIFHCIAGMAFLAIIVFRKTLLSKLMILKLGNRALACAVAVGFAVAAWFFRAQTSYLGDGDLLLVWLKNGYVYHASDAIDFFIHAVLYKYLLLPHGLTPFVSYSVISCLMGICYTLITLAFAKTITTETDGRIFAFFFILFSGYLYVFFGYVESYAMYFVSIMVYLYLALLAVSKRIRAEIPLVFLAVTLCLHQTGALLAPSAMYLIWLQGKGEIKKYILKYSVAGLVIMILAGVVIVMFDIKVSTYIDMLRERGVLGGKKHVFLPICQGEYAVFSTQHLLDYFNEQMLVSPIAFLILPVLLLRKETYQDRYSVFLLLAFAGYLLFFFFMDPKIEMFRDWDLFSVPAFVYTCFAAYHIASRKILHENPVIKILLIGLLALHTMSWVMVNSSPVRSTNRFKNLVELRNRPLENPLVGYNYEQISDFHIARGEFDSALVYLKKAIAASKTPRFFANTGFIYFKQRKYEEAIQEYQQAIALDPRLTDAQINLGRIYELVGRSGLAIQSFVTFAEKDPKKAGNFYYNVFEIYYKQRDADNALLYLQKAVENGYDCDPALLSNLENLCARLHQKKAHAP
ncbi:MAG: hypothetical protein A2487_03595 [Candidatus Raymondbacteria bacterium RifOxyC12_full_50_8]|nr:MAG: hypothetical protein A2487_03595 [Candidatus Raymondbacteria bacterium RifOxyC12_full_50_8]